MINDESFQTDSDINNGTISYGLDFCASITIRRRDFPKMQLITIEELLEGKRFDTPPVLGR